eukprot:jgi/Psemu1/28692/gm1.28692_g
MLPGAATPCDGYNDGACDTVEDSWKECGERCKPRSSGGGWFRDPPTPCCNNNRNCNRNRRGAGSESENESEGGSSLPPKTHHNDGPVRSAERAFKLLHEAVDEAVRKIASLERILLEAEAEAEAAAHRVAAEEDA